MKFKKGHSLKIISVLIAAVFIITNIVYGIDLPSKIHLRAPAGSQDTYIRMRKTSTVFKNISQQINLTEGVVILPLLGMLLTLAACFSRSQLRLPEAVPYPILVTSSNDSLVLKKNDKITFVSPFENIMNLANSDLKKAVEIISQYVDEWGRGHEENMDMLLKNTDKFINKPWAKEIFKFIAEQEHSILRRHGKCIEIISSQPWAPEIFKIIYDNPDALFTNYEVFINQPYAAKLLEFSAILDPAQAIEGDFKFIWGTAAGPPIGYEVIDLKQNSDIVKILRGSKDPAVLKLCELYDWGIKNLAEDDQKYALEMALLLDKIVKDRLSFEEAYEIAKNPALFLKNIIEITKRPDYFGKVSIDKSLKKICLKIVAEVNSLHNSPDAVRFKSVEDYDSEILYSLMVYGENEVFTSTFNGLFTRMLERMAKEGLTGKSLFEKMGYNKFRTMVKLCASFNRLNEFLDTMPKQDQIELLERFVRIKNDTKDLLSQAVTIADVFSMVEDRNTLKILQQTIKEEYEDALKEDDKETKVMYGLLSGMFAEKAVFDTNWFKEMSDRYKLPDITRIPAEVLFDNGLNIQRCYTYNDDDGKASYNSLINQYSGKSKWSIHDKETYTVIESELLAGRKIEMYINKPEFEDAGQSDIEEILKGKKVHIEVHVGHSYHANKTIDRINSEAELVILRSCGGYNEVSKILNKAPEAHIISTKGTGTMYVNDPLLYLLNNEILKNKDIIWPDFWSKTGKILGHNQNFSNYIAPHKNLGVMFLKAYSKLISSEENKDIGSLEHNPVFGHYTARQNVVFARLISVEEKIREATNIELIKMYRAQIDYLRNEFNSLENTRRLQPIEALFAVNESPLLQRFNGSTAIRICP
jgi:hypothetical protein